jgi:hypothetical protein
MKIVLTAAMLFLASAALAQTPPAETTFRGPLTVGTLDSSIGEDPQSATFLTDSEVGQKIFEVCKVDDRCEVTGKATGPLLQLVSVSRVRLLAPDASRSSVLETPSFIVRIKVRCPEGNVSCKDVIYTGKSKKNGRWVSVTGRTLHAACADASTPCRFQGYTFDSGNVNYTVREEGELIVTKGDKTLVREKGSWK